MKISILGPISLAQPVIDCCLSRQLQVFSVDQAPAVLGSDVVVVLSDPEPLITELAASSPDAIVLVASNRLEQATLRTIEMSGLSPDRVMGIGTVAESRTFRELIAARLTIAVEHVQAFVAGKRGTDVTPLWSAATVAGIPLHQWAVARHGKLSIRDRIEILQTVRALGATTVIPSAVAEILQAIVLDQSRILPVTVRLHDYNGISGSCLAVPCIVNRRGVDAVLPYPMNDAEKAGLKAVAT